MKTDNPKGSITLPKNKKQWKLYQQLGKFAKDMDRLPDAHEVQKNKARSAPLQLLPMVF
ncbi:hypothetical protein D3C86_1921700 [compost metagenome]